MQKWYLSTLRLVCKERVDFNLHRHFDHSLYMISKAWSKRSERFEYWLQTWLFGASGIKGLDRCVSLMNYSLNAPCKRFRPVLLLTNLEALGQPMEHGRNAALAIECIHTYSLIHDDLPSMDDDDLRRGQPSLHRKHGEAQAILAGDALLTLAFELLGSEPAGLAGPMVVELARAAGMNGMVAGQILDIEQTGKLGGLEDLEQIHRCKTAAMISVCFTLAALRAHQPQNLINVYRELGILVGMMFQVRDDILDVISNESNLGKSIRKDSSQGKLTTATLLGIKGAETYLSELNEQAQAKLNQLNFSSSDLGLVLEFLIKRDH